MKIGDKILNSIDQAIRIYDKLLLILSEKSIASEWVETEVEAAFDKERMKDELVLFPIRIDDAVMDSDQPWAAKIRRARHIGDFTDWKDHDKYNESFDRLIRNLKADQTIKS